MNDLRVGQLSGVALQYHFIKSVVGFDVIGHEEGPFAFYGPEMAGLCIVGGDGSNVEHIDLYGKDRGAVLSLCKRDGTSLKVLDDVVQCTFGSTTVAGGSYTEALMRAYVAEFIEGSK